jgi:hypothetical protein
MRYRYQLVIQKAKMENIEFDIKEWYGPKRVCTPDIEEDIRNYLGDVVFEKWEKSPNLTLKSKITIIAERLDLIEHLKQTERIVDEQSTKTVHRVDSNSVRVHSELIFSGHDFGGFQYDIEALIFYLYVSCIDAIQSQPKYKTPFKWLLENVDKYQQKKPEELKSMLKEDENTHSEIYGLRRNFIKAFTEELS